MVKHLLGVNPTLGRKRGHGIPNLSLWTPNPSLLPRWALNGTKHWCFGWCSTTSFLSRYQILILVPCDYLYHLFVATMYLMCTFTSSNPCNTRDPDILTSLWSGLQGLFSFFDNEKFFFDSVLVHSQVG